MIRVEVTLTPGARLTVERRRTIERSFRIGLAQGQIAAIIGKDKSTVSRELARSFSAPGSRSPKVASARGGGAGYRRVYDAERAQRLAQVHARRPKPRRLDRARLRTKVWALLRADWSPEQIAESLPRLFPDDPMMRVSHETIYQSLFVQTKGALKAELTAHLRTQRTTRKAQTGGAKRITLGITDDIRISARPAEAEDRAVPGHWEGDLVLGGTGKGAVITLVERSSRFVLLAPLPSRGATPPTWPG
jgi:IS30 family transposase